MGEVCPRYPHAAEDHLVEQILGPGERLVAGFARAPAVRQVGEVDNEAAFLGRDQIDGPCRRIGQPLYAPLLSGGCEATIVCNQRGAVAGLDPAIHGPGRRAGFR
jgi:hypothetical protein